MLLKQVNSTRDLQEEARQWYGFWRHLYPKEMPGRELICAQTLVLQSGPRLRTGDGSITPLWDLMDSADQENSVAMVHFLIHWASRGCPTFQLSHGLAAKLLLTDCSGLAYREVKWPFPSFAIQLPVPDPFIVYEGSPGKEVIARFILFHSYGMAITPYEHQKPMPETPEEFARRFGGIPALFTALQGSAAPMVHRKILEPDADDGLEEFLTKYTDTAVASKLGEGLQYCDLDGQAMRAALRLLGNFSLYLQGLRARGEWSPDQRLRKGMRFSQRHWALGGGIKLSPEVRSQAYQGVAATKWRLQARYMVRGHWRNQAHGPQNSLRSLRWIEPYWKGPDDGARLDRFYEMP